MPESATTFLIALTWTKVMMYKFAPVLGLSLLLGACSPTQFERPPVMVDSDKGQVECQFYLPHIVLWDEPVSFPEGMTREEAVSICRQEGMARKAGGVVTTATPL